MQLAAFAALSLLVSQSPAAAAPSVREQAALAVLHAPPFSVDARELYDAAKVLRRESQQNVDVVLVEARFQYDGEGGRVLVSRYVYWLSSPAGVRDWGSLYASWLPGTEARPELRARVIDGVSEHRLDATTLTQAPADDGDPDTYEDRQELRGPLPAARPGVLVEEVMISKEERPAFRDGRVDRFFFQPDHEARHFALVLEHPTSLPVRFRVRELRAKRSKQVRDGRVILRLEGTPPSKSIWGPMLPPWAAQGQYVAFSTGESWQSVASAYSDVVDGVLAKSKRLSDIADAMAPEGTGRDELARKVLDQNHEDIRYAALMFGHGGIVPRTPERTLERRYGDCKDKATLLVGVLRARGFSAQVALLRAWEDDDVLPRMPGLGLFNHAIVYLPADPERGLVERWIDPTAASVPFGELPAGDQGRLALIASPGTTDLTLIPRAPPADNVLVRDLRVQLALTGHGSVVETTRATGTLAHETRGVHVGEAPDTIEKTLRASAQGRFVLVDEEQLKKEQNTPEHPRALLDDVRIAAKGLGDRSDVEIRVQVPRAGITLSSATEAEVWVSAGPILEHVPPALRRTVKAPERPEDAPPKRRLPFQVTTAKTVIVRHHVVPPPGFTMETPPAEFALEAGGVRLTRQLRLEQDGSLRVESRLVLAPSQLTLDEVAQLREGFTRFAEEEDVLASFQAAPMRSLEKGDARAALDAWRARIQKHPKQAAGYIGYVDMLAQLGFIEEARRMALKGTALVQKSTELWVRVGYTHAMGTNGSDFEEGWEPKAAERGYRRALELSPEMHHIRPTLARVIALERASVFTSDPARLARALDALEPITAENASEATLADARLLSAALLSFGGRHKEILALKHDAGSDVEKATRVVAEVLVNGSDAGVAALSRMAPDAEARASVVETVVGDLIRVGAFQQAATLLRGSARHTKNPAAAIQRAYAIEQADRVVLPEWDSDVQSFGKRLLTAIIGSDDDVQELERRLSPAVKGKERAEYLESYRKMRRTIPAGGVPLQRFIIANLTLTTDGDDETGWLLRASGPGMSFGNSAFLVTRAARDRRFQVAEVRPFRASAVAVLALDHLQKGEIERARKVLSWHETTLKAAPAERKGWLQSADARGLTALAAMLLAALEEKAHLPVLRPVFAKMLQERPATDDEVLNDVEVNALHGFALLLARSETKADERLTERVLTLTAERSATPPRRAMHLSTRAVVVQRQKRWDAALAAVKEAQELSTTPQRLRRWQAQLLVEAGQTPKAIATLREALQHEPEDAAAKNALAWLALYDDGVPLEEALRLAQEAAAASQFKNAAYLHTLACLLVESGRELDGLSLARQIERQHGDEYAEANALIWGRSAQRFGLDEEARRILALAKDDDGATEMRRLVQRWLGKGEGRSKRE